MTSPTRARFEDASRGDQDAVEGLLQELLPGLRGYLRRHGGGAVGAVESSSDLAQSVCREVLEHLGDARLEWRGEAQFRAWLYNAAMLKLRQRRRFWRADRRDRAREVRPAETGSSGGLEALLRTESTPSGKVLAGEEAERLRRALDELPERYRRIIELSQLEGLGHAEVSGRLGISEANSRMLLSRALARLTTLALRRT